MRMIQEAASYRGVVVEHAVGVTNSGLPQFVAKFRALERYDAEEKAWVDWQGREDAEITAYLVLFGKDSKPIFHVKSVQSVFEWDGKSLVALNSFDLEGAEVQFEVVNHSYNGKDSVQVAGIRGYNEEPGSSVKKLDDSELAKLNAKYSTALKASSGGPAVVKAPASPPAAPPKTTKKSAAKGKTDIEILDAIEAAGAGAVSVSTPPAPPARPAPPKAPPTATGVTGRTMTSEEAWNTCYDHKAKDVTDEQLAERYTAAIYTLAPGVEESEIAGEMWVKIADTVISECGVF